MAIDITNIRKMVFGVNYLGANGGKVVEELWNSRFSPEEAYLIQGSLQEGPKDVFLRFRQQLVERGRDHMAGEKCILVFFADYTAELQDAVASTIWNLKSVFANVLGCQVDAVIQFAYVGEKGLDDTKIQKENIRKALENNNAKDVFENYRLCMVGKSALQRGGGWKSSIVFLDLLRRNANLQDYLPVTGNLGKDNVCFLRYGEFNENGYQYLVQEQKRLEALLTNKDSSGLRALVEKKRNELVEYVETQYCVNGALHPQHPDMIVEPKKGWFGRDPREAARKDKNDEYRLAQSKTRSAVVITGDRMRREIEAWFAKQNETAAETLQQFMEEAKVGVKLKLNASEMNSALYLPAYQDPGILPALTLRYTEQGAAAEIGEYLEYFRKNSIRNGLSQYTAALQAAYEAIPQEKFRQEEMELEKLRDRIIKELSESLDEESFCKKNALENPPESVFEINTMMDVKSAKFLLCRNAKAPVADKMAALGGVPVLSVNEHMCGIVSFDESPVKAVMIESVECKDWTLDQLLPEVNYGL